MEVEEHRYRYRNRKKKNSSVGVVKKLKGFLYGLGNGSKSRVNPSAGCFLVCVGPEKERFVIKTECANHPLFKMLLEDAESEYGFRNEGPLHLPCDVDLFYKVLAAMDAGDDLLRHHHGDFGCCSCSPFRRSYDQLTPPRMLKRNHHF
ncbi:auxin-responsive protein SAUR32-like [Andrographis paniculata]|uniref:auxin-responsive protein SAUR32-like n=1 Tax=Andrographis paniculata TaxID=175694 RepID=UPI0021E96A32|nr:auxin-responsive protein SAUR32-like [Andrographis paniculata]